MLQPCMMSNLNPSIEPNHLRQARWETWSNFVPTVNKLSLIDWFCSDVNSITFKHTTSIHDATIWGKRKKKHPTFSLNFFHILTYPFLILFRPLHASIYEKCLVRDLSLRQSRSLLYHFLWNIHFIWRPVDCPRASISRYTIILHKRWSPQAICI